MNDIPRDVHTFCSILDDLDAASRDPVKAQELRADFGSLMVAEFTITNMIRRLQQRFPLTIVAAE